MMDGLHNSADNLRLTYNEPGLSLTQNVHTIPYNSDWGFQSGLSASLDENGAWQVTNILTPGDA